MRKRIASLMLGIILVLSAFPLSVSAANAPDMAASYAGGELTFTGAGFDSGTSYYIRVVQGDSSKFQTDSFTTDEYGSFKYVDDGDIDVSAGSHLARIDYNSGGNVMTAPINVNAPVEYFITYVPGANGSVDEDELTRTSENSYTPLVMPDQGYRLTGWRLLPGGGFIAGDSIPINGGNVNAQPVFEAAGTTIEAEYDGAEKSVAYTGEGYAPNTSYYIRLVSGGKLLFMVIAESGGDGRIDFTKEGIALETGTYDVYVEDSSKNVASCKLVVGSYRLTVTASAGGTAKISGGGASGTFSGGQSVGLTASPNPGYEFVNWTVVSGGGSFANASSQNTAFTMPSSDATVRANFRSAGSASVTRVNIVNPPASVDRGKAYQLSAEVIGTGNPPQGVTWEVLGSSPSNSGTSISADGILTVGAGENSAELTVKATSVYDPSVSASVTVRVNGGTAVTYYLDVEAGNGGSVKVTADGAAVSASGRHAAGTSIRITASAGSGYRFSGWDASGVSLNNPNSADNTFVMPAGNVNITANFSYRSGGGGNGNDDDDDDGGNGNGGGSGSAPGSGSSSVSFDTGGGAAVPPVNVVNGGRLVKPADPVRPGYAFGGWYSDAAFTQPWDFATGVVTGNTVLYAKWIPTGTPFQTAGGGPVSINGRITAIAKNFDGSVTVTADDIAGFGGGMFVLGVDTDVAAGADTNAYVMVMNVNGRDVVMPFSFYENGKVHALASAAGTYRVISNPKVFGDIEGHWARNYINFVTAREIFSGDDNGMFNPDAGMTRAMFATVLANLEKADVTGYNVSRFTDVAPGQWYLPFIEWAAEAGLISGMGDGTFAPDALITREQMAVMLMSYVNYKGLALKDAAAPNVFVDAGQVSWWAADAVEALRLAGIMTSKPGDVFEPQSYAPRSDVAATLTMFVISLF